MTICITQLGFAGKWQSVVEVLNVIVALKKMEVRVGAYRGHTISLDDSVLTTFKSTFSVVLLK